VKKPLSVYPADCSKLIHLNLDVSEQDFRELVNLAVEYRQTIVDQLHLMDPEFEEKKLKYSLL